MTVLTLLTWLRGCSFNFSHFGRFPCRWPLELAWRKTGCCVHSRMQACVRVLEGLVREVRIIENNREPDTGELVWCNKRSGDGQSIHQLCSLCLASCSSFSTCDQKRVFPSRLRFYIQGRRRWKVKGTKGEVLRNFCKIYSVFSASHPKLILFLHKESNPYGSVLVLHLLSPEEFSRESSASVILASAKFMFVI